MLHREERTAYNHSEEGRTTKEREQREAVQLARRRGKRRKEGGGARSQRGEARRRAVELVRRRRRGADGCVGLVVVEVAAVVELELEAGELLGEDPERVAALEEPPVDEVLRGDSVDLVREPGQGDLRAKEQEGIVSKGQEREEEEERERGRTIRCLGQPRSASILRICELA